MDSIPNPVCYKDTKGVYLGCNIAFETITGHPRDEIIGHTVYELHPKDLADNYNEADSKLFQGPGVQMYEASIAHADGSRHDVICNEATYSDMKWVDGTLVGYAFTPNLKGVGAYLWG